MARIERQLAELVGGRDGAWSLWLGALAELEQAVWESRADGEGRFASHPKSELRRLRSALTLVLERAELAVDIRAALMADTQPADRTEVLEDMLLERARERADRRVPLAGDAAA